MRHAGRLLASHDFVGIQETHGIEGRARQVRMPTKCIPFWSHDSQRLAGIGLWVRPSFLQHFNPTRPEDWETLVPGRAAVLRLDGHQGALDLYVIYMPTGDAMPARERIRHVLTAALRPASQALSLFMGDWNYAAESTGRFDRTTAEWTGSRDTPEQQDFANLFDHCELEQEEYTHDSALGRSRLDRVYSNHDLADQLDRTWGCSVLT